MTLTYQIEREDTDVLAVVKEKSLELAHAHCTAWQTLRDAKVSAVKETTPEKPETRPELSAAMEETAIAPEQMEESPVSEPPQTMEVPPASPTPASHITPGQLAALLLLLIEGKWSDQRRRDYLHQRFSCDSVDDLSAEQAKEWLLELQRAEREAAQVVSQQRRLENAHRNGTP